ncbi:MAG: CBS domain-containing protein [Deltaproteobacteria bacterium]|jgi:CBS domain-containing protein|nr:CBS domain-containing protein [Deltaproteobacteria bacterium]MCW8892363.1 CBS domain-containing protein [Deltaproteobacteria bacterium]
MKTVKDILHEKGTEVYTVNLNDSVFFALSRFAEVNVGALVVVDDNMDVVGIVSERDYARKVFLKGISSHDALVKDIMTDKVCYAHPSRSVEECLALITEKRCRHLPVMENGKLGGLVSIGDLVKATIDEKEFLISQLTQYIKSG